MSRAQQQVAEDNQRNDEEQQEEDEEGDEDEDEYDENDDEQDDDDVENNDPNDIQDIDLREKAGDYSLSVSSKRQNLNTQENFIPKK